MMGEEIGIDERIDRLCVEFEDQILDNRNPCPFEFIQGAPEVARSRALYELIMVDLAHRPNLNEAIKNYANRDTTMAPTIEKAVADFRTRFASCDHEQFLVKKIDRYEVIRRIGSGGFGVVYEGFDSKLQRQVALKVPKNKWKSNSELVDKALAEARIQAGLQHPNILPIYDAGSCDDFPFYIVTALVEGESLENRLSREMLSMEDSISLISLIADALRHAHERGVIHRDIKPSNIMIDRQGTPYLVDFGLAIDESSRGVGPHYVGTPKYMSPEQARGEGHRVDQTTDIYSLGAVLAELLNQTVSGPRRQTSSNPKSTFDPPKLRAEIPLELKHVCRRSTSERSVDRYPSALAFIAGLENANRQVGRDSYTYGSFIPRNLRSFEASDAGFFWKLLPGPYGQDGMPEFVRALLDKLDGESPDTPSPVITLLGRSGGGKSSFVKAGLVPHLPATIESILIDARLGGLEKQIRSGLQHRLSTESSDCLVEVLNSIRNGSLLRTGRKLLIIIDQFESWLGSSSLDEQRAMINAMRQCDGNRIQFLLVSRNDYFAKLHEIMRDLEVPMIEGISSFSIVPFDKEHTTDVLTAFSYAYGKAREDQPNPPCQAFVRLAASQLACRDKVLPIRIGILATALRGHEWTVSTLKKLGGVDEVIGNFLKLQLDGLKHSNSRLPIIHKLLETLAPEDPYQLQANTVSESELRLKFNHESSSSVELDEVLEELNRNLEIIVKFDSPDRNEPYYRLNHDFLVKPLVAWCHNTRLSTRRGRAEVRLSQQANSWTERPVRSSLPTSLEYLSYLILTDRSMWNEKEKKLMNATRYRLAWNWLGIGFAVSILVAFAVWFGFQLNRTKPKNLLQAVISSAPDSFEEPLSNLINNTNSITIRNLLANNKDTRVARERLRMKQIKACLGEVDHEYFVDAVLNLHEEQHGISKYKLHTDEFINIVESLNLADKNKVRDYIALRIEDIESSDKVREDVAFEKARLAILGVYLDLPEFGSELCAIDALPEARRQFVFQSQWLVGDIRDLIRTTRNTTDTNLQSALINSVIFAMRWKKDWPQKENDLEVSGSLFNELAKSPDDAVASAAIYGQRRHALISNSELDSDDMQLIPSLDHPELVCCHSLRPGLIFRLGHEEGKMLASRYETTNDQFLQFLMDESADRPTWWINVLGSARAGKQNAAFKYLHEAPNYPVGYINLIDAMLYCNWLSDREGLDGCYRIGDEYDNYSIRVDNARNGYRLPTRREWNQISNLTARPLSIMKPFAWTVENCGSGNSKPKRVGLKHPNANGLFDSYGNVSEWAVDPNSPWISSSIENAVAMGGSFKNRLSKLPTPVALVQNKVTKEGFRRDIRNGFRVVRVCGKDAEFNPTKLAIGSKPKSSTPKNP